MDDQPRTKRRRWCCMGCVALALLALVLALAPLGWGCWVYPESRYGAHWVDTWTPSAEDIRAAYHATEDRAQLLERIASPDWRVGLDVRQAGRVCALSVERRDDAGRTGDWLVLTADSDAFGLGPPDAVPARAGFVERGDPWMRVEGEGSGRVVEARVNPGEAGCAFVKVFAADRAHPLSLPELGRHTPELVGWSDESDALFLCRTEAFVISEGTLTREYPARFELWFRPANGGPDRKLLETTHMIVGWER